jgi:3-deoxy-manno-octulosonate cytidylyltransferase (CMP-KDO synthetase)
VRIIGVIPARYDSSRFPGKPLIDLKGKSMIQRVYEGASKAKMISEIIVATDDERIFNHVKSFGGKAIMTSQDHTTGTDRCAEVARNIACDIVINIQGDEPLVSADQLDTLCKSFEDSTVEIATLGIDNVTEGELLNPNRIKIVTGHNGDALYFSRSAIPNSQNSNNGARAAYPFLRHIGLYGYRISTLLEITSLAPTLLERVESLEQLRWLYYGYPIRVVKTDIETPNIDVPEDVDKVLAFL